MRIQFVCLLLVLLTAPMFSQNADNEDPYKKFQRQHIIKKMKDSSCDDVMQKREINKGKTCKKINTFILANINAVKRICKGKPGRNGMTTSRQCFKIVDCKLKDSAKYPKCEYEGKALSKKIIIKCKRGLPVHYENHTANCEN